MQKNVESEAQARVNDVLSRLAAEATERQGTFNTIKTQLEQLTEDFSKRIEEDSDSLRKDADTKINEALIEHKKKQENAILEAEDTLKRLADIYGQAGQLALAGGFAQAASEEQTAYKTFSRWASGSFILSAVVLVAIWITISHGEEFDPIELLYRIPISLVILIPGLYFSGLARKHRNEQIRLKMLGLRVTAFDAYIYDDEESYRKELKDKMVEEFFAEKQETSSRIFSLRRGNSEHDEIKRLLDELLGLIKK
jgi:hypothetical protein